MQPGSNIKCLWSGLLCLLIFTGCGSLSKDAKHLMETGNYNAAIGLWDQVITKDPNDAEARFYRNLAQSQLLNEDLVTLKGLIDTRQTLIAFDQLKKFHQKRTQWGLGMNPNSSLYLKTQTERLYVRYLEMARQALDQNQVLRALWLEKQYRPLLDITPNEDEIKIKKDTQALGEKKCGTLDAESRTLADLRRYAVQYCKRFGKDLRPIESLERSILADQAQLKGVELKVERLNPNESSRLTEALLEQTRKLAHYSAGGKHPETLIVSGATSESVEDRNVPMSHSYEVQIPYTDYELVTRYKSVPYTAQEEHCTADASRCWSETVTQYRQEEERESVPVTKMRSEPRVYDFVGQETTHRISVDLELQVSSAKKTVLRLPYSKNLQEQLTSHRQELPDIGLHPKVAVLADRFEWLNTQFNALASQFYETQVKEWLQLHCSAPPATKRWVYINQALHCIRQPEGLSVTWIKQTTEDHEGLEPTQIAEVIGPLGK